MNIQKRSDLDKYSYQVGNYIVVRYPFGKKDWGYSCECNMVTTGFYEDSNSRITYPCSHIRALMELLEKI